MRFAPVAAASVIALGAVLGGFTASTDADAPEPVNERTVASAPTGGLVVLGGTGDNNGNG